MTLVKEQEMAEENDQGSRKGTGSAGDGDASDPRVWQELSNVMDTFSTTVFRVEREGDRLVWSLFEGQLAKELESNTPEMDGSKVHETGPTKKNQELLERFEKAMGGEPQEWVSELDGRHFRFGLLPMKNHEGVVRAVGGCIQEVTDHVRSARTQDHMAKDMVNQTHRLRRAQREAERVNYTLSHDLRNPLTVILSLCEVAEREIDSGRGDPTQRVEKIKESARRMDELLTDVLKLSRSSRIYPDREEVDVSAMSQQITRQISASQPHRDVTVKVEPGIKVYAEPHLMRDLMENLLSNAWKYTSTTDDPRIEVRQERRDEEIWVTVEDNGIGFDPEEKEKLFTPFSRLRSAAQFHGTGVGLATVKRIAQRHGGKVDAQGRPGQGARFSFMLPRPEEAPEIEPPDQEGDQDTGQGREEAPLYR